MITNILILDLVRILGTRANVDELRWLLRVIETTNFSKLPASWLRRGEGRSLAPGRRCRGADYMFYNLHVERAIGYDEAYLLSAPRARLPVSHSTVWHFHALGVFER